MNLNIPSSEKVFSDLASALLLINNSLEFGTQKTKHFFDIEKPNKGAIEPYAAATLTRLWAKEYLEQKGQIVHEDNNYILEKIPNIGLCLNFENYVIRILKTLDGELPVPGKSLKRQRFYEQFHFDFESPDNDSRLIANLVVLWETDKNYNLTRQFLALPKKGGTDKASVEHYWIQPFPDFVSSIEELNIPDFKPDQPKDLPIKKTISSKQIETGKMIK